MLVRLVKGGLLGAIVIFVWQGTFWSVLPFARDLWAGIPDGEAVMQQFRASGMQTGIYYFPEHPDPGAPAEEMNAAWERLTQLAKAGPTVTFMLYQAEGYDPMGYSWYVQGFLADLLATILMTILIGAAAHAYPRYGQRVVVCSAFGLIGILAGPVLFGSFYLYPGKLMLLMLIDAAIGWLLAGLLIAWATKPEKLAAQPAAEARP